MTHSFQPNGPNLLPRIVVIVLLFVLCLPSSNLYAFDPGREPAVLLGDESLVVPFTGGPQAVTTRSTYSGVVTLTVTGIGQASGTQFSDAFYLLTDYAGNPIPPYHPTCEYNWVLWINGQHAENLIEGQQVPVYRGDHSYTFSINAPGGHLTFGVGDVYTADNVGSYSVNINSGGSICTVPFFSQRNDTWKRHPLRGTCSRWCVDPEAGYATIGKCGCTLTSAAMLFAYYGAAVTPPQLSDCMGTKACPFYWRTGAACSAGKAQWIEKYSFSWEQLDRELDQNGRPVILGMHLEQDPDKTHWVLVTSGHGSNPSGYLVHDPWPLAGANTNLNVLFRSGYTPDWLSVYAGQPGCGQVLATQAESLEPAMGSITAPGSIVTGTVVLWHADETALVVRLSATSTVGQVTHMQVWTDSHPASAWQTFDEYAWLPWQPGDRIYARFRDEFGNVSDDLSETMHPESGPPAQFGTFLPVVIR